MRLKLSDNHRTMVKLRKLFECMDEIGLRIDVGQYGLLLITDTDKPDKQYDLMDVEACSRDFRMAVHCLPPELEFKLCRDTELESRRNET